LGSGAILKWRGVIAVVVLAALPLVAVGTNAVAAKGKKVPTKVKSVEFSDALGDVLVGKVNSKKAACKKERELKVFFTDPDIFLTAFGVFEVVGFTQTNKRGRFKFTEMLDPRTGTIKTDGLFRSLFQVKAPRVKKKRLTCKAGHADLVSNRP
jgi:hypothetical protein